MAPSLPVRDSSVKITQEIVILSREKIVDQTEIGRQLRARRAAAGRTVASVAADAGLSVPYIANLENGRGNPTLTALSRLAAALGLRLSLMLAPAEEGQETARPPADMPVPGVPASLVRFGRSARFRRDAGAMARALGTGAAEASGAEADTDELAARLMPVLASLGQVMGRDLGEDDWSRILDALLLVAAHPLPPAGR
jgi:DNA-binding phage protein